MPLYSYACDCGAKTEAYRTVKSRKRGPKHCEKPMQLEITGTHYIQGSFTPYQAIGRGRPVIKTRAEHQAYLRRNGYEEVGNDPSFAPPEPALSDSVWQAEQARKSDEMKRSVAEHAAIVEKVAGQL